MQMDQAHKVKKQGTAADNGNPLNYVEVEHGDKMVILILLSCNFVLYSPIDIFYFMPSKHEILTPF